MENFCLSSLFIFILVCLLCQTQKINKVFRGLNFEITNLKNSAPGGNDRLHSLVSASNEIIFGGTSCSHIGVNCQIIIQKFSQDFQLIRQVQLLTNNENDLAQGILECSDHSIILNTINKLTENSFIIFYKFSSLLNVEKTLPYYKKGGPGIIGLTKALEIRFNPDTFYRSLFMYQDPSLHSNTVTYFAIGINSNFNSSKESLDLINANNQQYIPNNIYFFDIAGSFFYHSGYSVPLVALHGLIAYICKYDFSLNQNCYVNSGGVPELYTSILQKDSQTIYSKGASFNRESFFEEFSILNNNIDLIVEKEIPYPSPYSIADTTMSLIINNYLYSSARGIDPFYSSILYRINLLENSQTFTREILGQFPSYDLTTQNFILNNFLPFEILEINSSHILSTGMGMFQTDDYDFFASFININNPNLDDTIVYGGSGNYINSKIYNWNKSTILVYGNDEDGLYLLWINKVDRGIIIKETKFRFGYRITSAIALSRNGENGIILRKKMMQSTSENYFASIDNKYYYVKSLNIPVWMINFDFHPAHGINLDDSNYLLVGSIANRGNEQCAYFIINSTDFSLVKNFIFTINIPGISKCKINFGFLSSQKKLYGVGGLSYTTGTTSGAIFQLDETNLYKELSKLKNVDLNSLIEINSTIFLAGGALKLKLTSGASKYPYFVEFTNNLEIVADLIESDKEITYISELEYIIGRSVGCISSDNLGSYLKLISINPLNILQNMQFYDSNSENQVWSLKKIDNYSIYAFGSDGFSKSSKIKNPLISSKIILSTKCNSGNIFDFDSESLSCVPICDINLPKEKFLCLKSINGSCVNCQIAQTEICEKGQFDQSNNFCVSQSQSSNLRIINESIVYDKNKNIKSITANFSEIPLYLKFPPILSLQLNNYSLSNSISFETYTINSNQIIIKNVKFPILDFRSIVVNLSKMQVSNIKGKPIESYVFYVNPNMQKSGVVISNLMSSSQKIGSFLNEQK